MLGTGYRHILSAASIDEEAGKGAGCLALLHSPDPEIVPPPVSRVLTASA